MAWKISYVVDHINFKLIFFPVLRVCFISLYKGLPLHFLLEAIRTEILKFCLNLGETSQKEKVQNGKLFKESSELPEIPQELY